MKKLLIALSGSCAVFTGAAHAADIGPVMDPAKWYVHLGAEGVLFDSALNSGTISGVPLPATAAAHVTNNLTASIEVGRYVTDNISFSLSAGLPPTNDIYGDGALAGLGRIGSATYGAFIIGGQYHITSLGQFKPYVGAGVSYDVIFGTSDGSIIKNFHVDNGFGFALQAGAEYDISEHIGLFVDAKKLFANAHATGNEFGSPKLPMDANLRLNPWLVSAGLNIRF